MTVALLSDCDPSGVPALSTALLALLAVVAAAAQARARLGECPR
jgi:hypothetical protein